MTPGSSIPVSCGGTTPSSIASHGAGAVLARIRARAHDLRCLGGDSVRALAESPRLAHVAHLGLEYCQLGPDDVRALAAILIQADRFGSSIAQALRVQSDSMRTRRKQIAEEKAAKTAVQLLFPLILFIFPGIFVVLVGPAAIQIAKNLLPRMS